MARHYHGGVSIVSHYLMSGVLLSRYNTVLLPSWTVELFYAFCPYEQNLPPTSFPRYRPSAGLFPIIVSQDCGHEPTANAIASYGNRITHIKVGVASDT